jgi:hypothetical protein
MEHQYSKETLRALRIPEEERSYQNRADQLTDNISRAVLNAAKEGKTSIKDFNMLTPELLTTMVIRQVRKRFPDSLVGYEMKEGSEMKLVYVDWT